MLNKLEKFKTETQEEGFTLIELMIVVVIIGILAAIAIPIFMNQQKAAIQAGMKSDVKSTSLNVATYLTKNPTANQEDIYKRAKGEGDPELPPGYEPDTNTNYEIVISHPDTTIAVYGLKGWAGYTIRAWNTTLDPDASLAVSGEYDVYFKSHTGKTTTTS